ncbi:helix-turn-helix and ligand-binding sensor domain-containing protein [Polaribacter ponticola]|uniref:LuxR C-terminal-related transcriptional regulator n=1 Tax=Polaribacter ponticola TaxID=2978475 RepID=A0ABT5S8H9_9FLAO|nr:LuxR C-terminal-related transcriptional regulator [Polaribacter sp. MSW5]MDD7914134.1 LuxR C-terminal-related transcriptional regulator [Polaribacter sp. MSW5]
MYIYDGEKIITINDSENILNSVVYKGKLIVTSLQKGLRELKGNKLIPHKLSDDYKKINQLATINDKLFLYDEDKGAVIYASNKKTNISKELNNLLETSVLNKVSFINSNQLLLGTIKNGALLYSINDQNIEVINVKSGLQNNTILNQKVRKNNIWLALDNGIAKIKVKNSNKFYKDFSGTIGTVYDMAYLKSKLYIASNTGLYTFVDNKLELVKKTEGHIWDLFIVDDYLICSHNFGTFIFKDEKLVFRNSNNGGIYTSKKAKKIKNAFLQGTYIGLNLLKKENNIWSSQIVKDISFPVENIEFESDSIIWATHPYKGIFRIKLNNDYSAVTNIESFGENENFKDYKTKIFTIHNTIAFYNNKKWFTYSKENNSIEEFKELQQFNGKNFIGNDKNGLWFIDQNKDVLYINKDNKRVSYINSSQIKERLLINYEKIIIRNDSLRLINLNDGFTQFNLKNYSTKKEEIEIPEIERIYTQKNSFSTQDSILKIPYKEAKIISLDFFTPNSYENKNSFSVTGRINSNGTVDNGQIKLQNLKYGNYTINIINENSDSTNDNQKSRKIFLEVLPPWYLSIWMKLLYFSLLIASYFIFRKVNNLKFRKKQIKIQKELVRDTQKKIHKIEKENLKKEVNSKKRVLAAITASIIKKNEIIIILRNELNRLSKTFPDQYISKKLLKVANESISNNRDWKMFEDSFNELHEDFFKKLVSEYPKLTSKDLKLCAYIKTGHTSKEIAPLMGISLRGVELHRYRLRKKLTLQKVKAFLIF